MEVHVSPDLKAKIDRWAAETGRSAEEFVEEALEGYFDELDEARRTLDSRYDDLASGKVQPIDGAEALERLREKSKAYRAARHG
jgi:predicted transcriptional regulator